MALFGKKKPGDGDNGQPPGGGGGDASEFTPQPEKARKWFEHGKVAADKYEYEYALTCYANGIKLDPELMSAHEAMYEAAIQYANRSGKPASGKEVRGIEEGGAVAKFAAAEFEWMKDLRNAAAALKVLDTAVKANQQEIGNWLASKMLNLIRGAKKVNKSTLAKAKDLFAAVGAWDEAITVGEMAMQMDPTDGALAAELKNLSAQRAMDQGGYERAAGQEGGYREMIKDADRQRQLEEAESIAGGSTIEQRNLERAQKEYEAHPAVPDVLNRYAQLLKKSGDPDDEQRAYEIYMQGFKDTGEYRFRMAAGDIRIDQFRRRERELSESMKSSRNGEAVQAQLEEVRAQRRALQAEELRERVEKYPTDRQLKYMYGQVMYELGDPAQAMGAFQAAKDEPKLRVRAGYMLGRCFAAEDWHREAIAEYREALDAIDATERDRELDIRYDLMVSLMAEASKERSRELAQEALEICSGIARKDITYRDIRNRRNEIEQLMKDVAG